jgi:uncharacterized protein (TIGR02594 family)
MKYILGAIVLILATACTSPGHTIENLTTPRKIINLGPINPVYLAVQYNGMHERTDRAELKKLLDVDPVRTEWCAAFVNAVLEESDIESNNAEHKYPLLARSFLDWGQGVSKENIQSGDLVVFPRGNQGWQGHVGFYLKTEKIDGVEYYYILGGNQSNKVSIVLYRASKALGIRRQPSIKRLTIFN